MPEIEYVMRCKLPSPSGFSPGPSGDTEYETAYNEAILENLPQGFEIAWRTKISWPVDRHGMTWVKLYRSSDQDKLHHFIDETQRLNRVLRKIRDLADQITSTAS